MPAYISNDHHALYTAAHNTVTYAYNKAPDDNPFSVPSDFPALVEHQPIYSTSSSSHSVPLVQGVAIPLEPLRLPSSRRPTKKKSSTHRRKDEATYVPRPLNSFFTFRKAYIRNQAGKNQRELSKQAGKVWGNMTEEQRRPYCDTADEQARLHQEEHTINNERSNSRSASKTRSRKPRDVSARSSRAGTTYNGEEAGGAYVPRELKGTTLSQFHSGLSEIGDDVHLNSEGSQPLLSNPYDSMTHTSENFVWDVPPSLGPNFHQLGNSIYVLGQHGAYLSLSDQAAAEYGYSYTYPIGGNCPSSAEFLNLF